MLTIIGNSDEFRHVIDIFDVSSSAGWKGLMADVSCQTEMRART